MGLRNDLDAPPHKKELPAKKGKPGIRDEEVCQILNLKKNLDYSDILIKYASKYLKLGWDLVGVNARGETHLEIDFREPEEFWAQKLTDLGMQGIQVNLGVRTGNPSRLVVLEVHRRESLPPFNQRGDWGSGCVAEVGKEREQHYYTVPRGWQPPPSYFLESFQIMVFGEEGMVLAPPSLEPQAQAPLRWLRPPWENPPTRPSPALCKFLKESAPSLERESLSTLPPVPPWAEIYPRITRYPAVLQALLAPSPHPEEYYRNLLAAARGVGLTDTQLLLGILWHAPMQSSSHLPNREEYLKRLVEQDGTGKKAPSPDDQGPPTEDFPEPGPAAQEGRLETAREPPAGEGVPSTTDRPPGPWGREWSKGRAQPQSPQDQVHLQEEKGEMYDSWAELFRLGRDHLIVERRRYEAMIYELGKLGAWQEFLRQQQRDNRLLREKIEAQWARELEYFRQLSFKGEKRGWRKW